MRAYLANNKEDRFGRRFSDDALRRLRDNLNGNETAITTVGSVKSVGCIKDAWIEDGALMVNADIDEKYSGLFLAPTIVSKVLSPVDGVSVIEECRLTEIVLCDAHVDEAAIPLSIVTESKEATE